MKFALIANFIRAFGSLSNGVDDLENFTSEMEWSFFVPVGFMVSGILVKQPPVCLQYLVFLALPSVLPTSCTMWKRSMMIRAFGNNALMYWAFRSTTTDFTAALSRFV